MLQFNFLLLAFLVVFFLRSSLQLFLNLLNTSYLRQHGNVVPAIFRDSVDQEKLKKISAYSIDSARFGILVSFINQAFFLILLLSGLLPWLAEAIPPW